MTRRAARMGPRGKLGRLLAAALVAAAAALVLPTLAAAHAELDSTEPAAGSEVSASPQTVTLTFSEGVDARLSLIKLAGQDGTLVAGVSPVAAVPGNDAQLQVKLSDTLPKGVYSVNWLSVSSDDGHVDTGAFTFGVGVKPGTAPAVVVPLSHDSTLTTVGDAVGKWLLYAALIVLVGAASTSLLVFGGRLPADGVRVLWLALVLGVVGLGVSVWVEKVLVGAPSLLPLFQTREGKLLLAVAVALALCAGAAALVDLWPARWSLWLVGAAGSATMLVHVLGGHAVSSSYPVLNVAVQWVHVTAVGVWVGGLFWLLLELRGAATEARAAAVGRFITVATSMLVVVLGTGLVRGLVEIGSLGALFSTSYGVTLVVKVALVAGLAALGALNHFFWAPAVRRGDVGPAAHRFGLNSRGELAVAACVLVATAVLTGLAPPPKPAQTAKTASLAAASLAASMPTASLPAAVHFATGVAAADSGLAHARPANARPVGARPAATDRSRILPRRQRAQRVCGVSASRSASSAGLTRSAVAHIASNSWRDGRRPSSRASTTTLAVRAESSVAPARSSSTCGA